MPAEPSPASNVGLQLYTVAKELEQDLDGTLAKLAAIGYRYVESAGLAGRSAGAFRRALDAAGLKCPSSHLFPSKGQSTAEYFDAVTELGSHYVVTSVLLPPGKEAKGEADFIRIVDSLTERDYQKIVDSVSRLAIQARSAGLQLVYHNHNVEFRRLPDGSTGYEILTTGLDPTLVNLELDCGWAELAGRSPLDLLEQFSGRVKMLHVKDFVPPAGPVTSLAENTRPEWTLLGKGHIDYNPLLALAAKTGVDYVFIEQEPPYRHFTALEAAKANFGFLKSMR